MSLKQAYLGYVLLFLACFCPIILRGHIIAPHGNDREMGADTAAAAYVENRKFNDFGVVFIPELHHHLHGNRASWLSVWMPYSQFGRPTGQLGGLSRAYLPSNVLSLAIGDPLVFNTLYTLITIWLLGTFTFGLLHEHRLSPLACLVGAGAAAFAPLVCYWLTFATFIAGWCWTAGVLYFGARWLRSRTWFAIVGLAFSVYSLFLTAYPQFVVLSAYLFLFYFTARLFGLARRKGKSAALSKGLQFLAIAALGVVCALPAYVDVAQIASDSARLDVQDKFYLAVLPRLGTFGELFVFVTTMVDPYSFGKPIDPEYPVVFNGLSLSPVYLSLLLVSWRPRLARRLWGWHLFILLCLAGSVFPSFYLFLVHHLGFHLSRMLLLGGAFIPACVLIGHVVDDLFGPHGSGPRQRVISTLFMTPIIAIAVAVAVLGLLSREAPGSFVHVGWTLVGLIAVGLLGVSVLRRSTVLLLLCVLPSTVLYSSHMILSRPRSAYRLTSSLTETLASHLETGERFAFVGEGIPPILPANSQVPASLSSIHTYNSLSSKRYQALIEKLGGTTVRYGRRQQVLDAEILDSPLLDLTGLGVLVSDGRLHSERIEYAEEAQGWWIHRLAGPSRQFALMALAREEYERLDPTNETDVTSGQLSRDSLPVTRTESFDDREVYRTACGETAALLFISREYHPKWSARSHGPDGGQALAPRLVNDFFLGFVLPPGTERVEVRFRPYVFWSFVPQILFGGAFLFFAGYPLSKRAWAQASRVAHRSVHL